MRGELPRGFIFWPNWPIWLDRPSILLFRLRRRLVLDRLRVLRQPRPRPPNQLDGVRRTLRRLHWSYRVRFAPREAVLLASPATDLAGASRATPGPQEYPVGSAPHTGRT